MTNQEAIDLLRLIEEDGRNISKDTLEAINIAIKSLSTDPKFKDDILEAYNKISDQEFEHTDNFWIVTPKGKKIVFEKERPRGKWVKWNFKTFGAMGDWEYKCSNCEKVYDGEYNFCPNCGADMRICEVRRNECNS